MQRGDRLWLAFEKFAIFFSFVIVFLMVLAVLVLIYGTVLALPSLRALRDDVACPMIADVHLLVDDLESAVITRTIPISQTIPVVFELPLEKSLNVELTNDVQLSRPTSFVLPAGGGRINGTVYLVLPRGQTLPVYMNMNVPVSHTLPVQMDVAVAIPLRETELGPVVSQLKGLLFPYLDRAGELLACPEPQGQSR